MFFRKFAVISRSENYYFSYVSTDWCIIYIFNDLIFLNSNLPQSGDYCVDADILFCGRFLLCLSAWKKAAPLRKP